MLKRFLAGVYGFVFICSILLQDARCMADSEAPVLTSAPTIDPLLYPTPTPTPPPLGVLLDLEQNIIVSGDYEYQILDAKKKRISIRRVNKLRKKIVIPRFLDGYKVVALGFPGDIEDTSFDRTNVFGEDKNTVQTLVIPEGVTTVGVYAFSGVKSLQKVIFPKSLKEIMEGGFCGCKGLEEIEIMKGVCLGYNSFASCNFKKVILHASSFGESTFDGKIKIMVISKKLKNGIPLGGGLLGCQIKSLRVHKKVKDIDFSNSLSDNTINCLTIAGKNTKIKNKANKYGSVKIKKIVTVPKAKAIKFAKKNHIKYTVRKKI